MSEKEPTIQRSGGRTFQVKGQQAQDSEVGKYGMFKNQKKPGWLKCNDWGTEWYKIIEKAIGEQNNLTLT